MKLKKLFQGLSIAALAVGLASCSQAEESTRNVTTPYGSLSDENYFDTTEASLSQKDYYNRLRAKSYDIVESSIKTELFKSQVDAIKTLITSTGLDTLTNEQKLALSYTDSAINEATYNHLKTRYTKAINQTIASSIVGTSDLDTYASYTETQKSQNIEKYINSVAVTGKNITKEDIVITLDTENKIVKLDLSKLLAKGVLDSEILKHAQNLYTEKEVYKIAHLETVADESEDAAEGATVKNSYYLFNEDTYESQYNNYYKKYGTYTAVVIQFNTRREAYECLEKTLAAVNATSITDENATDVYTKLYRSYYKYRGYSQADINETVTEITDDSKFDVFRYTVDENKDELTSASSNVNVIVNTLEDGQYLTEPRNINNKYVMAFRIDTKYQYGKDIDGENKAVEYADIKETFGEETYKELINKIQTRLIEAQNSAYQSTAFNKLLASSDLKIYDPFFEYKFNYSYSDSYTLINKSEASTDTVYKLGNESYTVEELLKEASAKYGYTIVTDYLQQSFINQIAEDYLTTETIDGYSTTLNKAIEGFENNTNSTYPSEIGLETFLLASYGYTTKEDVLNYYYKASNALSSYKSKVIFENWVDSEHNLQNTAILENILNTGNKNYDKLFTLNVDHILINIDDDANGTPDDPNKFLAKLSTEEQENFKNAVTKLANALYKEALADCYKENTLFETLKYIAKEYNKGATLKSDPTKTWEDFKEYNFLLTVEQLGDVTEESVSNFVTTFADYLKGMVDVLKDDGNVNHHDGKFYLYNTTTKEGALAESQDTQIVYDQLVGTSYGYHLIVLNEFEKPKSLKFTQSADDPYKYQEKINVLISEGEDTESDDDNIYAVLPAYNDGTGNQANLNQFFIYYIESKNGDNSSLDSTISTILETLFTDAISTYESSNFQTLVLLDKVGAFGVNTTDAILKQTLTAYRKSLVDQITEYNTNEFVEWTNDTSKFEKLSK